MSNDKLPESNGENNHGAILNIKVNGQPDDQKEKQNAGKPGRQIPSREDCMRAIAQLPGLVAMKILTAGQANAIRASYEALLKEHAKSQSGPTGQLSDDEVMAMFRKDPQMLSLIESLLTKDQVDMVIKGQGKKKE